MADVFGVLNVINNTAVGTYVAHTVAAGKSARVKFFYYGIAGNNSTISIRVNGIPIFTSAALTTGNAVGTTTNAMVVTGATTVFTGTDSDKTFAPGPREYLLSENDQVEVLIGTTAFSSLNFQVIGSEIDNG